MIPKEVFSKGFAPPELLSRRGLSQISSGKELSLITNRVLHHDIRRRKVTESIEGGLT